jgi:membrane-associated phospholipid phosphatase
MAGLDSRLYRDVNRLARHSPALHGVTEAWYVWLGVVVLGACVAVAWWRARLRPDAPVAVASSLWAAAAAAITLVVAQPVVHAIGRARPYAALPGVEVLVGRSHSFSLPSVHAAVAGAVIGALWWSDVPAAAAATVTGLLLGWACVYVGVSYPGDVVAGLAGGAVLAAAGRPVGMLVLTWLATKVERSPLHLVISAHR